MNIFLQIFTFLTLDHSNLLYRPIVHQVVRRDEMVMSAYRTLRDCHHKNLAIRVQVAIHLDYDMVQGNHVLKRDYQNGLTCGSALTWIICIWTWSRWSIWRRLVRISTWS